MIIVDCCAETSLESRTDFQSCLTETMFCFLKWFLRRNQQLSSKKCPSLSLTKSNPFAHSVKNTASYLFHQKIAIMLTIVVVNLSAMSSVSLCRSLLAILCLNVNIIISIICNGGGIQSGPRNFRIVSK